MLNALEPWHLIIIVGVVVVLFGAKRLPGSARSLGQSMRIFRTEMAQAKQDPTATDVPAASPVAGAPAAATLTAGPSMTAHSMAAPAPVAQPTQTAGDHV